MRWGWGWFVCTEQQAIRTVIVCHKTNLRDSQNHPHQASETPQPPQFPKSFAIQISFMTLDHKKKQAHIRETENYSNQAINLLFLIS